MLLANLGEQPRRMSLWLLEKNVFFSPLVLSVTLIEGISKTHWNSGLILFQTLSDAI